MAKLESANPTGSMKDRLARNLIRRAAERGDLQPGGTVVEYTAGTTGISLALVARALGARRLARDEAIFAGISTGANVVAALRVAERLGPDAAVATLIVDSGLRYLSTDVFR